MAGIELDDSKALIVTNSRRVSLLKFLTNFCKNKDITQADIQHVVSTRNNRVVYLKSRKLCKKICKEGANFGNEQMAFRCFTILTLPTVDAATNSMLEQSLCNYGQVIKVERQVEHPNITKVQIYLKRNIFELFPAGLQKDTLKPALLLPVDTECYFCKSKGHHFSVCRQKYEERMEPENPETRRSSKRAKVVEETIATDRSESSSEYSSGEEGSGPRAPAEGIDATPSGSQGTGNASSATGDASAPRKSTRNYVSKNEYNFWMRRIFIEIYVPGILSRGQLHFFLSNIWNSKTFDKDVKSAVGNNFPLLSIQLNSLIEVIERKYPQQVEVHPLKNIVSTMKSWIRKLKNKIKF